MRDALHRTDRRGDPHRVGDSARPPARSPRLASPVGRPPSFESALLLGCRTRRQAQRFATPECQFAYPLRLRLAVPQWKRLSLRGGAMPTWVDLASR